MMYEYDLLGQLTDKTRDVMRENLVGIYLHGSLAMDCFHPDKSDIDLLVVVRHRVPDKQKRRYMDMIVELNRQAPAKGIELSVIREAVCRPFVYPTPYELHFSAAHLGWYLSAPEDYTRRMKGTDKDLAAHAMILYHRGKTLYGKEIREVFSPVKESDYLDSIHSDVEHARDEITACNSYLILNLCRVLAYKNERLILSKREGGEWGLEHVPAAYRPLILEALRDYRGMEDPKKSSVPAEEAAARNMRRDLLAKEYADYMLEQIEKG